MEKVCNIIENLQESGHLHVLHLYRKVTYTYQIRAVYSK